MEPTIALPSGLLKKLLLSEVRRSPTQSLSMLTSTKMERWVEALENWRQMWEAMQAQPQQAKALLEDADLWKSVIQAIKPWYFSSNGGGGWTRAGDWNGQGETAFLDALEAERQQWHQVGWTSLAQANSSSEWMALMVLELEARFGVVPSEEAWGARVREAFERDSSAVMTLLLEQFPERSPVEALTRQPPPKSYSTDADPPLAHRLFDAQHLQASLALARHRPSDMLALVNARDGQGRTPLFRQASDLVSVQHLMKHGADPMARDHRHRLADEAAFQNAGPAETAERFHNAINRHRAPADQTMARQQWLAAMSTSCSLSLLKSLGLAADVQALTVMDVEGKPGTLLDYMLAFCDNRRNNKELLTLLIHLAKGAKGRQFLQANGSAEEGLAKLFALGLNDRAENLADRSTALLESVGRTLGTIQAEPPRLSELIHRTFELSKPVHSDSFHAFLGSFGLLGKVDLSSVTWDLNRLENARLGILRSGAYLRKAAVDSQDKSRWMSVAKWVLTWSDAINDDEALKARWLPCVLAAASALDVPELSQPLEARAVEWLVAGVQPAWENAEQEKKIMDRVETTLGHVMAKVRQQRMEQQLEPAARRSGPRL